MSNDKTPTKPSLLQRILVGNVESSPLRRVLGDQPLRDIFGERPFSDRNAPGREADRALNGGDRG